MNEGPWPRWGRISPKAQKAFILRQGEEGTPVAEICLKAGISQTPDRAYLNQPTPI